VAGHAATGVGRFWKLEPMQKATIAALLRMRRELEVFSSRRLVYSSPGPAIALEGLVN
jgi:hypothetical protein